MIRRWRHALESIRARLTLWYVSLLTLTLLILSGVLYVSLAYNLLAEFDRSLTAQAAQARDGVDIRRGEPQFSDELRSPDRETAIALYDRRGVLVGSSPRASAFPIPSTLSPGDVTQPSLSTLDLAAGDSWRVLRQPVVSGGRVEGALLYARSLAHVQAPLRQLLLLMLIGLPLSLLLAVAGGLFLAGRALGPIDRITRMAREIDASDLSRRLELPPRDDEVGRLAATFDQMLGRIEQAFLQQHRFTADASHELRTPLTVMASQVELALERPRRAHEYRATLASLSEEIRRLSSLVSQLLTLARGDADAIRIGRERLDLSLVAREAADTMTRLAEESGVALTAVAAEPLLVEGDQTRLTQLVLNLLDNALAFTPRGGAVEVRCARADGWAELAVADTGEGIEAHHLPRLFDRFYRADPARGRDSGGSGLGLAICRWIARAHGGDIRVESTPGRGSTFTVRLPVAADAPRHPSPPVGAVPR